MKKVIMFTYSILAYAVAFASIIYWIVSVSNLVPEISIGQEPKISFWLALLNNIVLIALFGILPSVLARPWFKRVFTQYFPKPIEWSTFVFISGLLLFNLVYNWQPMGGLLWQVESGSTLYYVVYALFFVGWIILFVSRF